MRYAIFLFIALACASAQTKSSTPRWHETDTETIWTTRYSNCDYGYSVLLPAGVVGHGPKSPNPAHGFTVDPVAPQSTKTFDVTGSNRYIDVFNFYDVEDHGESTAATLDYYSSLGEIGDQKEIQAVGRQSFNLAGLSARHLEDRWVENSTAIRRDRIIAYRRAGGMLYQFTLQSPEKTYAADEQLFHRIVDGFPPEQVADRRLLQRLE
ncbi:MAG: hypothetical protein WCC87_23660 [Candidatus Korobacteraceae bacterium]